MRWTHVLLATLVTGALTPIATADQDPLCDPVADASATSLADRYYLETHDGLEVWREANKIPGLQTNSEMACGAAADAPWIDLGASSI